MPPNNSPTRRRRKEIPQQQLPVEETSRHVELGSNTSPSRLQQRHDDGRHQPRRHYHHGNKKRRRQYSSGNDDDNSMPFSILVLQVGATLACLCLLSAGMYQHVYRRFVPLPPPPVDEYDDDDSTIVGGTVRTAIITNNNKMLHEPQALLQKEIRNKEEQESFPERNNYLQEKPASPQKLDEPQPLFATLHYFNVTDPVAQYYNAYALAERYDPTTLLSSSTNNQNTSSSSSILAFWQAAQSLREDFASRYGGENAAKYILEHGLDGFFNTPSKDNNNNNNNNYHDDTITMTVPPQSLLHTACRIQSARNQQRPFRMAFGGYSVTNGRGNYFSQSYPFIMERLLHTVFHLVHVKLHVVNHAIGGCPSFPYGWCLSEFLGDTADVISWDFSMNEAGGDPTGLEAYLRQALTQLPRHHSPMVIVKDTPMATQRRQLLSNYQSYLQDPLLLVSEAASDYFLELSPKERPVGFTDWRKFGAPAGAPGQALHHPGVKEHEFLAWLLTMHFLSALELMVGMGEDLKCPPQLEEEIETKLLPPPEALADTHYNLTQPWHGIFYGRPQDTADKTLHNWSISPIACRTTFEPIVTKSLSDLVVVGSVGEDLNVLLPKSKMFYNRGWVLDMSDKEKKVKHKLDFYGGLGFIDSKKAYYGLYTSGALKLLLPYEGSKSLKVGEMANQYFQSVVVCEVNEKRDYGECNTSKDVSYTIGGVANATATVIDKTTFMGKNVCVYIPVPETAQLASRASIKQQYAQPSGLLPPEESDEERLRDSIVGLEVQIRVTNQHIMSVEKACSVSHIVWEHLPLKTTASRESLS